MQGIYLSLINPNDSLPLDSVSLASVLAIASQCPYVAGDAVYRARALYAQYVDSVYFDDLDLCQPDTGHSDEHMMRRVTGDDTITGIPVVTEFVKVYPNPAKNLINLAYVAQTSGIVYFELLDELGQTVMNERLSETQSMAQYSTGNLSSGLYYWRLKDSTRTIKIGKVVIMK